MNILRIDATDVNNNLVSLVTDGKEFKSKAKSNKEILVCINDLMEEKGVSFKELNGIEVKENGGSFTGLRLGATIANTLSLVLDIPVNGKKIGEIVEPTYV